MCPLCISTATWFAGTTLLPADLAAVFVKVPRSSPPTTGQPCAGASINFPSKHFDGKEINSHA
jgi:hypothetical protein